VGFGHGLTFLAKPFLLRDLLIKVKELIQTDI
jgi:hypothetical protein